MSGKKVLVNVDCKLLEEFITPKSLVLQNNFDRVSIVRSFSTPVHINKLGSLQRTGSGSKGMVVLRSNNPRSDITHILRDYASSDASTAPESTQPNLDKGGLALDIC